jgi:hypothetical protein
MSKHCADMPPTTQWRRISTYLWAGTGACGPVGTVEQGRRFKAVDTSGNLVARCRDLDEAQALLEQLAAAGALHRSGQAAAA